MEQWAAGAFSDGFDTAMAVKNAGATGACSVFVDVVTADYNQIVIGASDEERERIDSTGKGGSSGAPGPTGVQK